MDRTAYLKSTDHRMGQYRSVDAPVQIAGCASTDHGCASADCQMHNFRPGNVAGRAREVVEKKKSIGNISESNLIYDGSFIFY